MTSRPLGRSARIRLRKAAIGIGEEHDPEPRGQQVVGIRRERVHLRVGQEQLDIFQPGLVDPPPRRVEHRPRDVDAGDMARGTDRLGIRNGRDPGADADIEHALARLRRGRREKLLQHLDIARFLRRLPSDPARPGDLVPVPLHRRVGGGSILSGHVTVPGLEQIAPTPMTAFLSPLGGEREGCGVRATAAALSVR